MANIDQVPKGWYEPWQFTVSSWAELLEVAAFIVDSESQNFYWRGQADERWGLTSSLHRNLRRSIADGRQYVIESDVSMEELRLKIAAEMEWRLEEVSYANFFLKLQHMGWPTRLIDVSKSPLIAAWFACVDEKYSQVDARLFAFGVNPNTYGTPQLLGSVASWPFNKHFSDITETLSEANEFLCWEPPYNLDPNLLAQQSAFILGHTPSPNDYRIRHYNKDPVQGEKYWTPRSVIRSTSLHVNFTQAWKKIDGQWDGRSAYTIRIKAKAKSEILKKARRIAGVTDATLFPNIEGFKRRLEAGGRDPFKLLHDRMFDLD
jgi:hypothetical protein